MKIVIWQSVLTEHQAHTLRALQTLAGEPIEFVLGARELPERRQQGWTKLALDGLSIHELPPQGWWRESGRILARFPNAVHIFCGLWADRRFFFIMQRAQMTGMTTSLMTEPYADVAVSYFGRKNRFLDRLKSIFRPVAYAIGGRLIASRVSSLFAISSKAVEQFQVIGFDPGRTFPFGYFVPPVETSNLSERPCERFTTLRLVFVGSLIQRKGLSDLIRALELAIKAGASVSLDVYGPGDPAVYGLVPPEVSFRGSIPFGNTQQVVSGYDILVLPSLYDGWGVVVNEALLQGVPALVSDEVGACVLVEISGAGKVFSAGNADELSGLLVELASQPERVLAWREAAASFRSMLLPETAAKYLYECLVYASGETSIRPGPPWYK